MRIVVHPPSDTVTGDTIGQVTEDEHGRVFVVDNLGIEQEATYFGGRAVGFSRPSEIPRASRMAALAVFKRQARDKRILAGWARRPPRMQVLDTCAAELSLTAERHRLAGSPEPTATEYADALVKALVERFLS